MNFSAPFEQLALGDEFASRGRTITEADVVEFAALTGDWHPQHTDAQWAASSVFGERIAHGMLIIAVAAGLLPFDPERVKALRRVADVTFKRPVRLGDTIHVLVTLAQLRECDEQTGHVGMSWKVLNQDERTVCRARVEVLWRRDREPLEDPFTPTADGFVPIPF